MFKRYVKLCAALPAEDLVKTTSYITLREDIGEYVKVRVKYLSDLLQPKC
jgi:hypothetical protein